jgi:hypothetical protein
VTEQGHGRLETRRLLALKRGHWQIKNGEETSLLADQPS